METLIFRPLGMESTTFMLDSPDLLTRMSVGYTRDRSGGSPPSKRPGSISIGDTRCPTAGFIRRCATWLRSPQRSWAKATDRSSARKPFQDVRAPSPATGYGLGLSLSPSAGGPLFVGHGGSVAGYNAFLVFDPQTKLGVSMLRTTTYNPPVAALLRRLVVSP